MPHFLYAQNVYEQATGGKCSTSSCYTKYTFEQATGGKCSTSSCYRNYCLTNTCYSGGSSSYDYDVSGYGDDGYTYGSISADSDGDVDGYLYLEDGSEVYFDGEFSGHGEIEGYDENGNYYYLDVD